mmetsp:Transcript_14142/g.25919  ORF Transcript_14142/g.25919 Transcript_14142/m.25919 type:complete len:115 (-) Transcript_14142:474-818(-)
MRNNGVSDAEKRVHLLPLYVGTNEVNCDEIEKSLHRRMQGLPKEQRLWRHPGHGTCCPKDVAVGTPYPYYCGALIIRCSLEQAGLRLGIKADRKTPPPNSKKRKLAGVGFVGDV